MRKKIVFLVLFACFILPSFAFANWFSMNQKPEEGNNTQEVKQNVIPVIDSIDRLILKRQEEARKLIEEGKKLIKRGGRKNNQDLIMKGKIKKEIGEKQLKVLKEQARSKKAEDANYGF